MTSVIGLRYNKGIILAADCLVTHPQGNYLEAKLEMVTSNLFEGYTQDGNFSGLVVGMTGFYASAFGKPTFTFQLSANVPNLAYLLLLKELTEKSLEEFNTLAKAAEYYEANRLKACASLQSLVNRTGNDRRMPFDLVILGFSTEEEPILVYLADRKITPITNYVVAGSGMKLTGPILSQECNPHMDLETALRLLCKAMNKTLALSAKFKGYQLVIAEQTQEKTIVSISEDHSAGQMDPDRLDFKVLFPNERQRKRAMRDG